MRLWCVLWCVLWAWACRGLPQTDKGQKNQAKECELYGSQAAAAPPVMQFQRRISVGVMPQDKNFVATLVLQSTITKRTCKLFFLPGSITCDCGHDRRPNEHLSEGDATELWMEVVGRSRDASAAAWELQVVGRQGRHRAHMLIPDTGLQPPVNLWLSMSQSLQYYFNCITGCLFEKSVDMPEGDHTFFVRHDEGFLQMTINCGFINYSTGNISIHENTAELSPASLTKELSINVTAAELGPPGGLKEITVVWSTQAGDIGVLVDGVPLGDLIGFEPLKKERQVKVKVAEEGSGLVAPCDPHFQMVAGGGDEQVTTTTTEPSTTASPTTASPSTNTPSTDDATSQQPSQQPSSGWLPAVFTFVLLNFIITVAAIGIAVFLYCRASSESCHFTNGKSDPLAIFSRRTSTRSSTRSGHRGSQRRKTQNDAAKETSESHSEHTRVNSETVTTPLTTPESKPPRITKQLSTDEFDELSLI